MHQIIRVLVFANDKEEALSNAGEVLDNLCENNRVFDYYSLFTDEDSTEVSGKGRWGDLPEAVLASSKEGKKLIEDGINYTKKEFIDNLKKIKRMIKKFSMEDLFNERSNKSTKNDKFDLSMFKHWLYLAGMYQGTAIWLYDQNGDGIKDAGYLKNVLDKWECNYDKNEKNPDIDKDVWVVPADVHC